MGVGGNEEEAGIRFLWRCLCGKNRAVIFFKRKLNLGRINLVGSKCRG